MAQRGRPRVKRDPDERVPMSTRIRGEIFNHLSEVAEQHDRPLGQEVEYRLEASVAAEADIYPEPLRQAARQLLAQFLLNDAEGAAREIVRMADPRTGERPDRTERRRRWRQMLETLFRATFATEPENADLVPEAWVAEAQKTVARQAELQQQIEELQMQLTAARRAADPEEDL